MIINKLPQILFTILGLLIAWIMLTATQDLTTVVANLLAQ